MRDEKRQNDPRLAEGDVEGRYLWIGERILLDFL